MHLRRAILLMALVLGLAALAASITPTHEDQAPVAGTATPASGASQGAFPRTVPFTTGAEGPGIQVARAGEHLLVTVASPQGGLVTIPELGRAASADSATPAQFDLLAPPAGRYDVLFSAGSVDEPRRVGTLLTRP